MRLRRLMLPAALALGVPFACSSTHDGRDDVGAASSRLEVTNGESENGLSTNGLLQNGAFQNGAFQNGAFQNGAFQNGAFQNGAFQNGVVLNGVMNDVVVYNGLWQDTVWQQNKAALELLRKNFYTRQTLQYLYKCAMKPMQGTVIDPDPSGQSTLEHAHLVLKGEIGLTPGWGEPGGYCDEACQRWNTACVLARTNAYGVNVDISMRAPADAPEPVKDALRLRAPDPAKPGDLGEVGEFALPEGAFYGNLFRQVPQADGTYVMAPEMFACAGPGSNTPEVTKRFCSSPGADGPIKVVGTCQSQGGQSPGVCTGSMGEPPTEAMTSCFTDTDPAKRAEYKEVITVYLKQPLEECGNRVCEKKEVENESCPSDCHPGGWAKSFKAVLASKSDEPGGAASNPLGANTLSGSVDARRAAVTTAEGFTGATIVNKLESSSHHSCAIVAGGEVRCWGYNQLGQLGDGTTTTRLTPVPVVESPDGPPLTGAQAVAVDGYHSCAILAGGGVRCWGDNTDGQLGDGTTASRGTPEPVLESAGGLPLTGAQALALGFLHSCALVAGGMVRCWGDNYYGQLGAGAMGDQLTSVTVLESAGGLPLTGAQALAVGGLHGCALVAGGMVRCWGDNYYGQLGDGTTTTPRTTPVAVLESAEGPPLAGVQALALGGFHSCALLGGGEVYCWGLNDSGQLGDGTTTPRTTPVAVLESVGGAPLTGVQALSLGYYHSCALLGGGEVRCWGKNDESQLGDGTTGLRPSPVPVLASAGGAPLTGVQALAIGGNHSCALLAGGTVRCWGTNDAGQLGDGTTTPRPFPVPVQFGPDGPSGDPVPPGDAPMASELPWATISALGPSNEVVLAGVTPSDVDLGGGTLPSLGTKPGVLAKYDKDGNYLRGTRFAMDGALYPASVVVASGGQIVVAATTQGEGGRQGWLGAFVEEEGPDGVVELKPTWSRSIGVGDHTADKLAVDRDGNLFVAGTFYGSVTFGATTLTSAADGKPHAFVSKMSPDGAPQWAVRLAPDARSVPIALAVDGGGNALLSIEAEDSSTGLWKLSAPSGAVAWRQWGWHDGVVADAKGDVYSTGSLSGAYDFDVPAGAAGGDLFVARYDGATGAPLQARVVTQPCNAANPPCGGWFVGHTIALDQAGDVVVGVLGGNKNVINFGQGAFRMYKTPDAYVAAFSPNLDKARWSKHLPLILEGSLLGMQLSGDGRVMMTGTFSGSMMVDDRLLITHAPEQPGIENTFLAAFRIPSAGDDDAPPVVNELRMPKPMWLEATGQSGAQVFYVLPSATDGGNFGVSADCSPPPDTTFAIGTTLVECVATNPLGNQSSQSFTVTVVDNLGPVFGNVPASIEVEASSPSGEKVTFAMPTAVDAVDGPCDVTCTRESGSEFAIGSHIVTCSAKDAAPKNNEARTMFGVTVVDKPPVLSGAPAPIAIDAAGPTTVTFATPSALDHIDGPLAVACVPESGSAFPLGTTQVVCSATDTGGNRAEVSFTVTVANATAPVISVPAEVSATAACNDGAYVSYQASALDAIDGPIDVACSPPSGAEFAAGTTIVVCTAGDAQGNVATASFPLRVTYDFGGVLQPVNADGSSLFKLGSTVAVKFKLKGLSAPIDKAHATLSAVKVSDVPAGTVVEAYSNAKPDTDGVFNYDWSKKHYVYNLGTAGLSAGTWQLQIDLGDGVARSVQISLKN